jgi:Sec-independent protein translocase protein TatA
MNVFNDVCLLGLLSNLIGRDLIVILIVGILIFFGVRNLPDIMRAIRRLPSAFRKGLHDEENSTVTRDEPSEDPKNLDRRE